MKKSSGSKVLADWTSVYKLAALLDIDQTAVAAGRKQKNYSRSAVAEIRKKFITARKTEMDFFRLQVSSFITPIVANLYGLVRSKSLHPDELPKYLNEIIYVDQPEVGKLFSSCEIPASKIKQLCLSSEKIRELRGPKEAAAVKVAALMGFSGRKQQSQSARSSDAVAFVIGETPTSTSDLSQYHQALATEILCKTFHLDRTRVAAAMKKLFVPY